MSITGPSRDTLDKIRWRLIVRAILEIKDRVLYKVPFGIPGDLVAGKWVRKDLEKVFTHRHKTIDTLLAN